MLHASFMTPHDDEAALMHVSHCNTETCVYRALDLISP